MSKTVLICAAAVVMSTLGPRNPALALNQATHKIVNEEAAIRSSLDSILRLQVGIGRGLLQRFGDRSVTAWIGEGGIREDDGIRFFRHFHDPLKPWTSAGLEFFGQFQSSIHWMQRPADCLDSSWRSGKDWTWSSARCYFHRALIESKSDDRDLAWAYTFRAVGQLMHLVVDASVPEHTRNDPHPLGGLFGSYEYWVESAHGRPGSLLEAAFIAKYLATPVRADSALVEQPTNDAAAPVPIAHMIDADVYTGADPNVTLTSPIGIAEFANANFFSEDSGYRRLLAPTYPYPSVERLVPSTRSLSAGRGVRAYYKKGPGDGLPVDPVLAECALDAAFRDDGIATLQYKCADENVWEQTAAFMLPRAVGYAAALLDYFFRGRLETSLQFVNVGGTLQATLSLTNRTPGETMTGTFAVYVDSPTGDRTPLSGASWALSLAPDATSSPLVFSVPGTAPVGPWLVVFQGTLGLEVGAVAVGRVAREVVGFLSYRREESRIDTNPAEVTEIEPPLGEIPSTDWSSFFPAPPLIGSDTVDRRVGFTPDAARLPSFTAIDDKYQYVLLRDPASGASRMLVTVYASPYSDCSEWDRLTYFHFAYRDLSTSTFQVLGPAIAEIVELPAPPDLATYYRYTYRTLPGPIRTLLTVSSAAPTPQTVDIAGVTFLGIRLLTVPADPGPQLPQPPLPEGHPLRWLIRDCQMVLVVRFEQPNP